MTDQPSRPSSRRLTLIVPAAVAAMGLLTWLDWSRREPRLKARTADRLR